MATAEMTRAEFEALVDKTYEATRQTGLPQTREQLAKDLLARFAQRNGITAEEAEKLLDKTTTPTPAPEKKPRKKTDLVTAAKSMRELTAKGVYFYEAPEDMAMFDTVIALNRQAGVTANMLITGPSGCGKTEGVEHAAQRAGIPFYAIDCPSITSDDKWIGHKEFTPEKGTIYVLSDFLRAIEAKEVEPGLILLDEINRLHPTRMNIVFPLLAGTRRIWVPELGITIEKHPDVVIMATANIGVGFTGTHRMDDALVGRFGYRMEKTWPSTAEEVKILINRMGIDGADAKTLVQIAQQTRNKTKADDLPFAVSTRDLLHAAALVAAGMTVAQAAEWTFVKFYDDASGPSAPRVMVRQIVQGKSTGT
jgi:MoxR-like ATPase